MINGKHLFLGTGVKGFSPVPAICNVIKNMVWQCEMCAAGEILVGPFFLIGDRDGR